MRDYGKVGPKFWIGETGKALKRAGPEAIIIGLYLMTSPHSNMLGLYYLPEIYVAHETGLGIEGATKGLQCCIDAGFCGYDRASEMVWVYEMATYQIAERLSRSDKRSLGVQNAYDELPRNPFLAAFYDKYSVAFNMTSKRGLDTVVQSPSQAPSMPLPSQEQEQEQEQKQEQDQNPLSTSSTLLSAQESSCSPTPPHPRRSDDEAIEKIFAYWQQRMKSPKSVLDDKRRKAIRGALEMGYSPTDLCRAIRGCSLTPHNMGNSPSTNPTGQKYNGIALILRSADQIDRFIANDKVPPRQESPQTAAERREAESDANLRAFLGQEAPSDPMIIDMEPS